MAGLGGGADGGGCGLFWEDAEEDSGGRGGGVIWLGRLAGVGFGVVGNLSYGVEETGFPSGGSHRHPRSEEGNVKEGKQGLETVFNDLRVLIYCPYL